MFGTERERGQEKKQRKPHQDPLRVHFKLPLVALMKTVTVAAVLPQEPVLPTYGMACRRQGRPIGRRMEGLLHFCSDDPAKGSRSTFHPPH